MESSGLEDVLILDVEPSTDCLCVGVDKSRRNGFVVDKGKASVNLSRRGFSKKTGKVKSESMAREDAVIILDDSSGSETDYIEMVCARQPLTDTAVADSKPFSNVCIDSTGDFCPDLSQLSPTFNGTDLTNGLSLASEREDGLPAAKKIQLSPPSGDIFSKALSFQSPTTSIGSNGMHNGTSQGDIGAGTERQSSVESMETDSVCPEQSVTAEPSGSTNSPKNQTQLAPSNSSTSITPSHHSSPLSTSDMDLQMAINLDKELNKNSSADEKLLKMDEEMAKKMQQEEYLRGMNSAKHGDERLARNLLADELYTYSVKSDGKTDSKSNDNTSVSTSSSNTHNLSASGTNSSGISSSSSAPAVVSKSSSNDQLKRYPTCWTTCPNCSPDDNRKFHLIDVEPNSAEWDVVTSSLTKVKFSVTRVERIQNETLWQRLSFEKQLMLRDRRDVNEQLLYHTSRAEKSIICEEGLDPRLSRNGYFGVGMYFSDDPIKCNNYWQGQPGVSRRMFCCRVLLGDIKRYPRGKSERLVREPPKENPRPGEPKTYDSVQGNITGQNEYVVYNAYRVMPEYIIEYSLSADSSVHLSRQQLQYASVTYTFAHAQGCRWSTSNPLPISPGNVGGYVPAPMGPGPSGRPKSTKKRGRRRR